MNTSSNGLNKTLKGSNVYRRQIWDCGATPTGSNFYEPTFFYNHAIH